MRKNFTLYPLKEAVSVRTYVHESGDAAKFHEKGVKLIQSFLAAISKPGQQMMSAFHSFKKAMSEPQHLGQQRSGGGDVTSTLRNVLREIYGPKRFDKIDETLTRVEKSLSELEHELGEISEEDVSQSLADMGKSRRQLSRETPPGVATPPAEKMDEPHTPLQDAEHDEWKNKLPVEGTPDWTRWVASRAEHIRKQKEAAHGRGDTSKGDDLHGNDWWDKKAHWKQAEDEIKRYINSGKDNKNFVWSKHFHDWRACIGDALNEYHNIQKRQDDEFFKSIIPPKPKAGYM
jgi:hypothetical protein